MPNTKTLFNTAAPADGKPIGYRDYKRILEKCPRCTDIRKMAYVKYRDALKRCAEYGTDAVKARAGQRLRSLSRAVNGYTAMETKRLKQTPEHRAYVGPHPKGQQCKPVFVARFPPTDSKALRIDDKNRNNR